MSLLVLKLFDGLTPFQKMQFSLKIFWIQLHCLSLACMNIDISKQMGKQIGVVKEVDAKEDGYGWGHFLRIIIKIDLQKPISRGRSINSLGIKVWIPIKYEKLCFKCGRIVHGSQGCLSVGGKLFV